MPCDPEPFTDAADRLRLAQFVVYQVRSGDLPDDVRQAARRLARDIPRPPGWDRRYHGANYYRVTGFPVEDGAPLLEVQSSLPDVTVGELLAGPVDLQYVLVTPV